jgi:hypothetical protein
MGGTTSTPAALQASGTVAWGDEDTRIEANQDFLQREAAGTLVLDYSWMERLPRRRRARARAARAAAGAASWSALAPLFAGGQGAGAPGTGTPPDQAQRQPRRVNFAEQPILIPPFTGGNHAGAAGAGAGGAGVPEQEPKTWRRSSYYVQPIPPFMPKRMEDVVAEQTAQVRERGSDEDGE